MFEIDFVEGIGYLASLVLMVSFTMKKVKKLRIINTLACIIFIIYGFYLNAWPIIISNAFIAIVNLYYLITIKDNTSPS